MKISKIFNLDKTQFELDFVDIDPAVDTPLFLDPYYISKCDFPFAIEAHRTIRSYFEFLLAFLKRKKYKEAEELFSHLGENNEICMGMSSGTPCGRGMGPVDTRAIFAQLVKSRAVETGIMEDIEDFRIFVPNVDKDKVSDMTANIIKFHLINYTIEQCALHGIPLTGNVPSGMFWNRDKNMWDNIYTSRLIIDGKPILLVPKRIVSFTDKYTPNEYRQHYVLNYLQNEHLSLGTGLVQKRKNGEEYVTKKSVVETEPHIDKEYLSSFTELHPEIFAEFKGKTFDKIVSPTGAVLDSLDAKTVCDFLIKRLKLIPAGTTAATQYHRLIVGILELLLYPDLSNPKKEKEIHEGRKRIDIVFDNSAESGFFYNLPNKDVTLPCPFVFVECKNYTGEVSNPELDQLSGRFSNRRGRVGILTCRTLDDKEKFMSRCSDTLYDDRGLIIPICDEDLIVALTLFPECGTNALEGILQQKYEEIVFMK